jgi:hypothetical protein
LAMPNPVADTTPAARATGEAIAAVIPPDDDPIDVTLPYPVQQCQLACKGKFVTCTGCMSRLCIRTKTSRFRPSIL